MQKMTVELESKKELFEAYGVKSEYDRTVCDKCNIIVGFNADKGQGLFLCRKCWRLLDS